jgi:hypothetical protein
VQGQIQADQLQAQQGAGNFQNLTDVLSGVAQQGAASRGAESQMAQLMFDTGLGQDRAGYQVKLRTRKRRRLPRCNRLCSSQGLVLKGTAIVWLISWQQQLLATLGGDTDGDGNDGDGNEDEIIKMNMEGTVARTGYRKQQLQKKLLLTS